jgi:hypothetical protein
LNSITNFLIGLISIIILSGCNLDSTESIKLARIEDKYLFLEDVINEIPINLKKEDSIVYINNYVNNWITSQLIVKKAQEMIPNNLLNVDKKIEKYRKSLISYEFEQFYISKRLDTSITTFETLEYYNQHSDDFVLNDYIIKCLYLKIPKNSSQLKNIKKHFKLYKEGDIDILTKYAQKSAETFYFNEEEWLFYDDLLKQVPIEGFNKVNFITQKKKIYFEKESFIYFVNIYDFRIKDGTSPLSFEKEKIKSILLNIRANELRKELRSNLYSDGIENNSIEIF